MKHCIIAKFNDSVSDKAAMTSQIEELFSSAPSMDGVHGCTARGKAASALTSRPRRYSILNLNLSGRAPDFHSGRNM